MKLVEFDAGTVVVRLALEDLAEIEATMGQVDIPTPEAETLLGFLQVLRWLVVLYGSLPGDLRQQALRDAAESGLGFGTWMDFSLRRSQIPPPVGGRAREGVKHGRLLLQFVHPLNLRLQIRMCKIEV